MDQGSATYTLLHLFIYFTEKYYYKRPKLSRKHLIFGPPKTPLPQWGSTPLPHPAKKFSANEIQRML